MPRLPARRRSRRTAPQDIPWQVLVATAMRIAQEGQRRWNRLSESERDEVQRLLKRSKGRWTLLSEKERKELRRLVWKAVGPDD